MDFEKNSSFEKCPLIPSLKELANRLLQPNFPFTDEFFRSATRPLGLAYRNDSEDEEDAGTLKPSAECSADGTITELDPESHIRIKSPEMTIVMKKSDFLCHCDAVKRGARKSFKSSHVMLKDSSPKHKQEVATHYTAVSQSPKQCNTISERSAVKLSENTHAYQKRKVCDLISHFETLKSSSLPKSTQISQDQRTNSKIKSGHYP